MNKLIFASVVILVFTNVFAQGPWTKGKNKAYLQIGFSGIFYDKVQINKKPVDLNVNISDVTTQFYGEYGITDQLDCTLILPYKSIAATSKVGNLKSDISGLSNITLGLKYKLLDNKWKISSGLFYSASNFKANESIGLRTGFGANTYLPYVTAGSSSGNFYYFGNIGYCYMSNDYTDFLKVGGEIGYKVATKSHLILNLDLKQPLKAEKYFDSIDNSFYQFSTTYIDKQQFIGLGLKFNNEFIDDKFGANLGINIATNIDNLPSKPSYNFGVYYKL